jgi:hypothetical protein
LVILLLAPLLFVLLGYLAVKAKRARLTSVEVALIVFAGTFCNFAATFGVLAWGFSGFS